MNLKDYVSKSNRGHAKELAKSLGVSKSFLSQMVSGVAAISPERCVQIESLTNGIVTRKDLKPNNWEEIWPELNTDAQPCTAKHT